MKTLRILASILDILIDLFIKGTAIYFIIKGDYLSAVICFGMNGLWCIPIMLFQIYRKFIEKN